MQHFQSSQALSYKQKEGNFFEAILKTKIFVNMWDDVLFTLHR